MSYNYLLCFRESRFWPCPCEVKIRDEDSSVLGKSSIPTCAEKGILCAWASRDRLRESHGFCLGNKSTLKSSTLFVWRLRPKNTWRTMRSFSTRLAKVSVCLSKKWSQISACQKDPRGSPVLSPLQMGSLKSFCLWYWSLFIWDHGNKTSWDTQGGHLLQKQMCSLWYCSPPGCLLKNWWKWFFNGQPHKRMPDLVLG